MRMSHYYLALAVLVPPALLATAATGLWHDGSNLHLACGLFTAIFCVAVHTLLILFMIVTGRVLKAAMAARPLPPEHLAELNSFFARKKAYPVALLGATLAVATAVLGYGRFIGVPTPVHMLLGLATVVFHLWALPIGWRTLRDNQGLVDRVAAELDRLDAAGAPPLDPNAGAPDWRVGPAARWALFAAAAWLPYLYWGLIVWRGRFERVGLPFLVGTAGVSALGLWNAWRARGAA